jgi:hypothetical protein
MAHSGKCTGLQPGLFLPTRSGGNQMSQENGTSTSTAAQKKCPKRLASQWSSSSMANRLYQSESPESLMSTMHEISFKLLPSRLCYISTIRFFVWHVNKTGTHELLLSSQKFEVQKSYCILRCWYTRTTSQFSEVWSAKVILHLEMAVAVWGRNEEKRKTTCSEQYYSHENT